jgi:hypothetical protein
VSGTRNAIINHMEIEILAKFENATDGMMSYVFLGERGYHVVLKDVDADESVAIKIYPVAAFDLAVSEAERLVGVEGL